MTTTTHPSYIRAARADGVPPGSAGPWRIERFEVTRDDAMFAGLRAIRDGRGAIHPGTYTRLVHARRGIVMSDSPDELRDMVPLYSALLAEPRRVLIHGLGLGCALRAVLACPTVEHVDLVEVDPDVVALYGPMDPRVAVHVADARTLAWPPGTRWDVAWHDIWDELTEDNDYGTLNRRFGRRVTWQGAWGQAFVRAMARRADRW